MPQRSARLRLPGYGRSTPTGSRWVWVTAWAWYRDAQAVASAYLLLLLQVIVEKAERSDIPDIDKKK